MRDEHFGNMFCPNTDEFKLLVELQPRRSTAGLCWYLDQGPEPSLLCSSRGMAAEAHPCTSPGWWSLFLLGQQRSW